MFTCLYTYDHTSVKLAIHSKYNVHFIHLNPPFKKSYTYYIHELPIYEYYRSSRRVFVQYNIRY